MLNRVQDRKSLTVLVTCLAGLALLAIVAGRSQSSNTDNSHKPGENAPVAATVNGAPIYQGDVEYMRAQIPDAQSFNPESETLIEDLIEQRLLAEKAKASGLADKAMVNTQLRLARDQILANALIEHHIEKTVTDEALRKLYDSQSRIRQRGVQIRARQILIPDAETAAEVIKKLNNGESFSALAFAYSLDRVSRENGGDMGYFTRDSYPPEFAETVFATSVGSRTDAFETPRGWHLVEVTDRRQAPVPKFEELKDELTQFLKAQEITNLLERLKSEAVISRPDTDTTPDSAHD